MKSTTVFFLAILLTLTACQGGKRNVRSPTSTASIASAPSTRGLSSAGGQFVQALKSDDMGSAYGLIDERVKQKLSLSEFTQMNSVIEQKAGKIVSYAPTGVIQTGERLLKDGTRQKEHTVWYAVTTSTSKSEELRLKVVFNGSSSKVVKYNFVRKAQKTQTVSKAKKVKKVQTAN